MKTERTPWFPANVKPARVGIYETRLVFWPTDGFSFWNGAEWCNQGPTPERARAFARTAGTRGANQDKKWRGLTKESK